MKKWKNSALCLSIACGMLAVCLAGCKETPKPIVLPYDHGPHFGAKTEWWYFSGELQTDNGTAYGYEMTIFKVRQSGLDVFVNHLAVSDLQTKVHSFAETTVINTPKLGNKKGKADINADALSFTFDNDTGFHIEGSQGGIAIDLQLLPVLPVVLEADNGTINMPDGHISYYYSFTNLKTTGTLTLNGTTQNIISNDTTKSRSWMDHQWGLFSISADAKQAWDWFSFRFEDGSSLMAAHFREKGTNEVLNGVVSNGLLINPHWMYQRADGTVERGTDVSIDYARTWKDANADATYAMDWTVSIPSLSATISAVPAFDAQSLYNIMTPPYWEGIGTAESTIEGNKRNATAYIEMCGYDTL